MGTLKPFQIGRMVYHVSPEGIVYRKLRDLTYKPLKVRIGVNGYKYIRFRVRDQVREIRLHRIVLTAFYGAATKEWPHGRHLNGDKTDNHVINLDWGTQAQNMADMAASGIQWGENNPGHKLTLEQVVAIRASSDTQWSLAAQYQVSQMAISNIKTGKKWNEHRPVAPPPNLPRWTEQVANG